MLSSDFVHSRPRKSIKKRPSGASGGPQRKRFRITRKTPVANIHARTTTAATKHAHHNTQQTMHKKNKQQEKQASTKAGRKLRIGKFKGCPLISSEERGEQQRKFKVISAICMSSVHKIGVEVSCVEAIKQIATAVDIDAELVSSFVSEHVPAARTRKHSKNVASVTVASERGNVIYRVVDTKKRCHAVLGVWSVGPQNVEFCVTVLLISFVCGIVKEELTELKAQFSELV